MRAHRQHCLFGVVHWSADGRKAADAGDNGAVVAAGAMNNQQIAALVAASDDADVFIAGIKYKVAG